MSQRSFLDGSDLLTARARRTDPATSHKAAATTNVARSQRLVLAWLDNYGPSTAEDAENALSISPSRCRGAIAELVRAGKVRAVNKLAVTKRGRACRIYEAIRHEQ